MNSNKRNKSRPPLGGAPRFSTDNNRQQQPKMRAPAQGIYNNTYFMHAGTALVGNVVQIRVRSGTIFEGVFRTFSPNFDVCLELPTVVKRANNKTIDDPKSEPKLMIFPHESVVSISAKDFDSQYATSGAFQTDAAISEKCNGARFEEKELEPWDASGMNGDIDIELDGASNGWDANEMFRKNENTFGVTSTFDDSLSSYTVALDKLDSDEFKEAEAKAEKLAAEIENNPNYRERLDLENGDEEQLYAAVERPDISREREQEREKDREREREREREKERERDRDGERKRYEPPRDMIVQERYISKSTRSITGQSTGGGGMPHSGGMQRGNSHERHDYGERGDRMLNSNSAQTAGVKNSSVGSQGSSSGGNQQTDKYGSNNMMKRKPTPGSGGKMSRNAPSPGNNNNNNNIGGNVTQNNNVGGGVSMNNNNNMNTNSNNKNNSYAPISSSSSGQNTYPTYSQVMHGGNSYRGQQSSHMMSSSSKLNGESNVNGGGNKPLPQRPGRQYQGSGSNSSVNYGDQQNKNMMSGNNSVSPPLQNVGGNQNNPTSLSRPQRSRENQLQEFRQFGQDYQLANNNNNNNNANANIPQHQHSQQQQQQQQQHAQQQQQQMVTMVAKPNVVNVVHTSMPPPTQQSLPPPPQQQQQQDQTQAQQQQLAQPSQHVVVQQSQHNVQIQQHIGAQQQQQQQQQNQQQVQQPPPQYVHHIPPTQHAVLPPPPHHQQAMQQPHYIVQQNVVPQPTLVQHMAPPPPLMQTQVPGKLVDTSNMSAPPPPLHQQAPPPQQQQTTQQLQQNQTTTIMTDQPIYHTIVPITQAPPPSLQQHQQQVSPVLLTQAPPPQVEGAQITPPQQQQQQQLQNKNDLITPTSGVMSSATDSDVSSNTTSNNNNDKSSPNSTPTTSNSASISGTTTGTTTVVKKTHVLNPSAKPFTPRSPSTPNPSRPHTPQTPVQMAGIYTTGGHVPVTNNMYMMPAQQPAPFQAPTHPPTGQPPRMRRTNYGSVAPSQLHVSPTTATGQPLLAAGPFLYGQPHGTHYQQPYGPVVPLYRDAQQPIQFLAQPQPSTTPSPGQPHQSFHPQPQPSPAGGGPQPTFAAQAQPTYQIMCPLIHPSQLMPNPYYQPSPAQHHQQQQQFVVMQPHPTQ